MYLQPSKYSRKGGKMWKKVGRRERRKRKVTGKVYRDEFDRCSKQFTDVSAINYLKLHLNLIGL